MNRNTPQIITERSARYTDVAHSEVELTHPFEGIEGHKDNGKKSHAYYDVERYQKKQSEHGQDIYPEPTSYTL